MLDELAQKKQLSDERYAEARAYQLGRKYGAAHIAQDLRAKGLAEDTIERAAEAARAGELERARAILRRKYRQPAATREERGRRARFLLGRGFSGETIQRALKLSPDADD